MNNRTAMLIIAGFLCSYVNPKDDKRIFKAVKIAEKTRLVSVKKPQLLIGPIWFPIDRWLGIYDIISEDHNHSMSLMATI